MSTYGLEAIFPFMDNIDWDADNDEFITLVKNRRESVYSADKRLLADSTIEYCFDAWADLPEGRFCVNHKNYQFDCCFHKKEGPLFVILNGALFGKRPEFKRWSYYNFLPGSMLNIADPMYYKFKELKLGWYYGDHENNLRELLAEIVVKAARMLGLSNNQIVLIGSSGGGAAVIHAGGFIKGCTVIAINAQIKLSLYYYHKRFTEIIGIDLCREDDMGRNDCLDILKNKEKYPSNFILIDNLQSKVDRDQINYLSTEMLLCPIYGVSQFENITFWIYDAIFSGKEGAHGAQEFHEIFFAILFLAHCVMKGKGLEEYQSLFRLFGELWREHFNLTDKTMQLSNELNRKVETVQLKLPEELIKSKRAIRYVICEKITASKEENYKNYTVCNKFKASTIYCLYIQKIDCVAGYAKYFTILIKDLAKNCIYCRKNLKFGSDIFYYFRTATKIENLELRIYCGMPAHTEGVGINIENMYFVDMSS